MKVKVLHKDTMEILYEGDIRIEDGVFYFPTEVNLLGNILIEVNDCIVEPIGHNNIVQPKKAKKTLFKLGYKGDWNDLKQCPCCKGRELSPIIDYMFDGEDEHEVEIGKECDNCGWSTEYLTCKDKHYLEFLIKKPKNIINKNI